MDYVKPGDKGKLYQEKICSNYASECNIDPFIKKLRAPVAR